MAIYETIFILDSLIPPKDIETTIQKYSAIISDNNGTIRKVDKWGKRRLAYEIQKKQYGYYVAIEFDGTGTIPRLLESDYNYNDKVLRYLTYRYDKNKLRAMEIEQKNEKAKQADESPERTNDTLKNMDKESNIADTNKESLSEESTETKTESVVEEEKSTEDTVPDEEGEEEKS